MILHLDEFRRRPNVGSGLVESALYVVRRVRTELDALKMPLLEHANDLRLRPTGGPLNRRAECWQEMKDWLEDEGGASIPDRDDLRRYCIDVCRTGFGNGTRGIPTFAGRSHIRDCLSCESAR